MCNRSLCEPGGADVGRQYVQITEKLSDAILGIPALPRIEAEVWHNPEFQTSQKKYPENVATSI